ncbi:MAG: thioredoxin fold domain-containing protein [Ignavibacteriae bacterium]|nr:thioredoxin fold domain-containing protein [Ignavibacteriota bacterium]
MKSVIKTGILLLVFVFAISLKAKAEEINFEKGTFKEVLAKAKTQKKILMIDFFTDWCKWCVELDKKVYTDKDVSEFANKKQINWKIDAEKGEGIELAKKYAVNGFPTIVFVDGNGDEVDRIVGYIPANDFLKRIKEFSEGVNTYGSITKILKKNPDDVKANYLMGERIITNDNDVKKAEPYFKKVIEKDPNNKEGYKLGALLYLAMGSGDLNNIKKFIQDYPDCDKCKSAYIALAEKYYMDLVDFQSAKIYYDKAFELYGKTDEDLKTSYIQYLLYYMNGLVKKEDATAEEWKQGIDLSSECLELAKGSVNEGSAYYFQANFYFLLGDKENASIAIDKAIEIRDAKVFKDLKSKINN